MYYVFEVLLPFCIFTILVKYPIKTTLYIIVHYIIHHISFPHCHIKYVNRIKFEHVKMLTGPLCTREIHHGCERQLKFVFVAAKFSFGVLDLVDAAA